MTLYEKAILFVSMETIAVVFSVIILIFHINHQKPSITKWPLTVLFGNQILLLLCQIMEWSIVLTTKQNILPEPLLILSKFLYAIDFLLYDMASVFYFNYVESVISSIEGKNNNRRMLWTLYTVALLSALCFVSSLFTGWFYTVLPNGSLVYKKAYWILIFINLSITLANIVFIMRNATKFEKRTMFIYLSYLFIPFVLIFIDQIYTVSYSYLSMSIIHTIIYLGAELQRDWDFIEHETKLKQAEAEAMETKAQLMVSQIQPHFIFNALSVITYLCKQDPEQAEQATLEFAGFLKGNLRTLHAEQSIAFTKELEHLKQYLNLQHRRFGELMQVRYEILFEDFSIPPLSIQPIVENAIHHAVEQRFEPTTITIRTEQTDQNVIITVSDNGPGFDVNQKPKDDRPHIGIYSVRSRLEKIMSGTLEISSTIGQGTCVKMILPKRKCCYENFSSR